MRLGPRLQVGLSSSSFLSPMPLEMEGGCIEGLGEGLKLDLTRGVYVWTPCLPSRGEPVWVLWALSVLAWGGGRLCRGWRSARPAGMLSPVVPHWFSWPRTPFLPSV